MPIIALPAATRIARKVEWSLDRPAQVNRSAWTGKPQVIANPWHGIWRAQVDLVPIIGETAMLAWRAFLAQLKGQINSFRLPATEGLQAGLPAAINHNGAAAGATTMLIKTAAGGVPIPTLLPGHMMTSGDQLLQVVASAPDVGTGTTLVTFEPPLRAAIASLAAVEIQNPTALVALTDSKVGWSVEPGKIYGVGSLQVEERW